MRRQTGFTLVELLVVIAILGILFTTAVPVYRTWQQRAYGSEAAIMLKQLINAEIAYYLENDEFFPDDKTYYIPHSGDPTPAGEEVLKNIYDNLNISIPQGHFIEYVLHGANAEGDPQFYITITSKGNFDLFKGAPQIYATLDKNGMSEIYYASYED